MGGEEGGRVVESEVFGVAMAEHCRRVMSAETLEMKVCSRVRNDGMKVKTEQILCQSNFKDSRRMGFQKSDAKFASA